MTVEPLILRIGSFELSGFGLLMLLGFVIGAWVIGLELRHRGWSRQYALDVFIAAAIGGILGAKLWYAALYRDPAALLDRGGMVFWGGLIGGTLAVLLTGRWRGVPGRLTAEIIAAPAALGYALGRIGCFLVGDDYGLPTALPWGVKFPHGLPPSSGFHLREHFGVDLAPGVRPEEILAVHPTQLYEAVLMLAAFWLLWRLRDHGRGLGWRFGLYLVLAGAERFLVELLRAKDDRFYGDLTLAQLTAVAVVAAGLFLMRRWRPPDSIELPGDATVLRRSG